MIGFDKRNSARGSVGLSARLVVLLLAVLVALTLWLVNSQQGRVLVVRLLFTESVPRTFIEPPVTRWKPEGVRRYSRNPHPAARPVTFGRALHTDLHGSDEIATAIAPMFELDWTAETNMFVAEGPVFDSEGNVYFSPVFPPEPVLLVSLDGATGERRWVLPGDELGGAGTPLILQDPELGQDRVYTLTYNRALATDIDGNTLWDVPLTGAELPLADNRRHCYGANYHIQSDSIIGVMGDGTIQVLDRASGRSRLAEPFVMPGAPTAVTNFSVPPAIAGRANRDIAHMYPREMEGGSPVEAVLHAAAGELQQVTNFFSIDTNSGRIWVASTLPDGADGKEDGWADLAALYGLDLVSNGEFYSLKIAVVAEVPGGTASTPAISADGERIYVADAFDSVYAIDAADGRQIWSYNVGGKVTGSLDVAADNGEVYANTRTGILQLLDRGDYAELGWKANLDSYQTGRFQRNFKALGAEIAANGVAFTGAAGIVAGKQKFPLRLGAGIIDRKSGEIRYFVDGAEDSVSSMVTGPDGGLYVGNSPLRRVLGRATFGKSVSPQPVVGGVTRFKPVRYDLFLRDVLKAAADRAANAATLVGTDEGAVAADVFQIRQLLAQCRQIGPKLAAEHRFTESDWVAIRTLVTEAERELAGQASALQSVAAKFEQAISLLQ